MKLRGNDKTVNDIANIAEGSKQKKNLNSDIMTPFSPNEINRSQIFKR